MNRKHLSVSATDLSKMVLCEANVLGRQVMTREDERRLERGTLEHKRFEQAMTMSKASEQGCPLSKVAEDPSNVTKQNLPTITLLVIAAIMTLLFMTTY